MKLFLEAARPEDLHLGREVGVIQMQPRRVRQLREFLGGRRVQGSGGSHDEDSVNPIPAAEREDRGVGGTALAQLRQGARMHYVLPEEGLPNARKQGLGRRPGRVWRPEARRRSQLGCGFRRLVGE